MGFLSKLRGEVTSFGKQLFHPGPREERRKPKFKQRTEGQRDQIISTEDFRQIGEDLGGPVQAVSVLPQRLKNPVGIWHRPFSVPERNLPGFPYSHPYSLPGDPST